MTLICYPNCTTCRRARAYLDALHISYVYRDIKEDHPTPEELKGWQEKSGLPPRRFFNTSGRLYQNLKLKEKLPAMSGEEQNLLLGSDGLLVKRPILVGGDFVLVGFHPEEWEAKLK
jgi:arsenate reductase